MKMVEPGTSDFLSQVSALATEGVYVAVGFGVLGFQRLQVRRRELEAQLPPDVVHAMHLVGERAQAVAAEFVTAAVQRLGAVVAGDVDDEVRGGVAVQTDGTAAPDRHRR
jgi:hypothetical protein